MWTTAQGRSVAPSVGAAGPDRETNGLVQSVRRRQLPNRTPASASRVCVSVLGSMSTTGQTINWARLTLAAFSLWASRRRSSICHNVRQSTRENRAADRRVAHRPTSKSTTYQIHPAIHSSHAATVPYTEGVRKAGHGYGDTGDTHRRPGARTQAQDRAGAEWTAE